jgi:hypothetical protein
MASAIISTRLFFALLVRRFRGIEAPPSAADGDLPRPILPGAPAGRQYATDGGLWAEGGLFGARLARSAAFVGVPYRHPTVFLVGAVAASRAVPWLQRESPPRRPLHPCGVPRALRVRSQHQRGAGGNGMAQKLGIDIDRLTAGTEAH